MTAQPLWNEQHAMNEAYRIVKECRTDKDKYDAFCATLKNLGRRYEAEIATLQTELVRVTQSVAEKRKPMRVVIQPDFVIDLEDE